MMQFILFSSLLILFYYINTVPDRSNLTGNALPERLGNAKRNAKGTLKERKGNAKRTQEIERSVFRGTRSWECVLEVHKIQWNTAKDDA